MMKLSAILFICTLLLRKRTFAFSVASSPTTSSKMFQELRDKSLLRKLDRLLTSLQNPKEQLENYLYLQGNYAPVYDEHSNVLVETLEYGAMPKHLRGMLIRNGPNPTRILSRRYHWFDGHAMLHMLRFSANEELHYSNFYVPCERYEIENVLQEDFFPTVGDYTGIWGLIKIFFHVPMVEPLIPSPSLNASPPNTSCIMYRNKFYCLNEGRLPFEVRINRQDSSLTPVGSESFGGQLNYPVSAHPKVDKNGDLIFHSYTINAEELTRDGPLKVGRYVAKDGTVDTYFGPFQGEGMSSTSFVHNVLLTDDFLITYQCSVEFDPQAMFTGGSFFRTKPEKTLRFGLIPKGGSKEDVLWIDTGKSWAIVHPLNSWQEEDGTIVIWTPICENLNLDLDTDSFNEFRMMEFRLDPSSGTVIDSKTIDDSINVEFSVAPVQGEFTRFGYTAIQDQATPGEGTFSGFCIWDMLHGNLHKMFTYEQDVVGGEPMILTAEDGAVYVGVYQHNLIKDISYFCLYDGTTTDLVARWKLPYRVPYGFHGTWVNEKDMLDHFAYHEKTGNA